MNVTLDASVWLSALTPTESAHARCAQLVATLQARRATLYQPGLFIVEVCATIARRTRHEALARAVTETILRAPRLRLRSLSHDLAVLAADVVSVCTPAEWRNANP